MQRIGGGAGGDQKETRTARRMLLQIPQKRGFQNGARGQQSCEVMLRSNGRHEKYPLNYQQGSKSHLNGVLREHKPDFGELSHVYKLKFHNNTSM